MRILLPQLEHPDLRVEFGASEIEALQEYKDSGVGRESKLLGRGVLTINEVRCQSNLPTYLGEIRPSSNRKGKDCVMRDSYVQEIIRRQGRLWTKRI